MCDDQGNVTPAVPLHEHLHEFIERWQDEPAEAIACASTYGITVERAHELIEGTGEPMLLGEAADIGMMMGPSVTFWQRLWLNHRNAAAVGKVLDADTR